MSSRLWVVIVCVFLVAWVAASGAVYVGSDWSISYVTPGVNGPERVEKGELGAKARVTLSVLFGLVPSAALMCVLVPVVLVGRRRVKRRGVAGRDGGTGTANGSRSAAPPGRERKDE